MILKMYAVKDFKVDAYLQPFFMATNGAALRSFSDAIKDGNTTFCKHPEDFALYEVGSFDDAVGLPVALGMPNLLALASDLVV